MSTYVSCDFCRKKATRTVRTTAIDYRTGASREKAARYCDDCYMRANALCPRCVTDYRYSYIGRGKGRMLQRECECTDKLNKAFRGK